MILYRTPLLLTVMFLLPAVFFANQAKATTEVTKLGTHLPQEHQWVSLSAVNNVVWAGSDDGYVALSTDAGKTFELSRLAADASLQQLHVRQLTVLDDHHGYALTSGVGERSGLYITRNGGFSWRPLYRGDQQEQLRCMGINPTGEAWILGDSQNEHWHVVRSNNGKHWKFFLPEECVEPYRLDEKEIIRICYISLHELNEVLIRQNSLLQDVCNQSPVDGGHKAMTWHMRDTVKDVVDGFKYLLNEFEKGNY